MTVHLMIPDSTVGHPKVYCGAVGASAVVRPMDATCVDCALARLDVIHKEKRPLGLFAIFYDGETRPVAGFVLEQDAEWYAKEHSGSASWEIRHVHVVEAAESERNRAEVEGAGSHPLSPLFGKYDDEPLMDGIGEEVEKI